MTAPASTTATLDAHDSRLASDLLEAGLIEEAKLEQAKAIFAEVAGKSFQRVLTDRGFVDPSKLAQYFAQRHGLEHKTIDIEALDPQVAQLVPYSICTQHVLLPFAISHDAVHVAIAHPLHYVPAEQSLQAELGRAVHIVLATEAEIRAGQRALYADECSVDDIEFLGHGAEDAESESPAEVPEEDEEGESAVGAVNTILAQSIARGASDIHIDPGERAVRIRLRVDGQMIDLASVPPALLAPLVARIKVVSGLDIGERRLPQDGAIQMKVMGRRIDVRVNTLPNVYGERVCMRILDATSGPATLDEIGFLPEVLSALKHALDASHGIILVTGPTGSGKSSTLYASLRYLNRPETNIMTVEDPVEFRVEGISQTQTHGKIGFDFARVLEAFLRQDPDVILLGEVRNQETAEIATRASLTGHSVLTTLHVQSAVESITRLVEMGVPPYVLASTLRAVVAQRLLRRLCRHCRVEDTRHGHQIAAWGGDPSRARVGGGCPKCSYSGYKGRLAITELFVVDATTRDAILANKNVAEIQALAQEGGMLRLGHCALRKVEEGLTSVAEALPYLSELAPTNPGADLAEAKQAP